MTVLERIFAARVYLLGLLGAFTLFAGYHATQLTFQASPDAHLPRHHPIAAVARALEGRVLSEHRLAVSLRAERGSFVTAEGAAKLAAAEQAVAVALRLRAVREGDRAVSTELSTDGRMALVSAELPPRGVADIAALRTTLSRALASDGRTAVYRAEIFTTEGAQGAFEDMQLAWFILCAVSALILAAGLLLYSGSFAVTGLSLVASATAVAWTFGLWHFFVGNLEPSLLLLAFLVFALGIAQAFALARPLLRALVRGVPGTDAARIALSAVAAPALATLGASTLALAALALVPIPLIEQGGEFGALGVLMLAPASLLGLPLALASIAIDRPLGSSRSRSNTPVAPVPAARAVARRRLNEVAVVMLAGFALVAVTQARLRPLGPAAPTGALAPVSTSWDEATARVTRALGNPLDRLVVIAETPPEGCTNFRVMDYLDRLSWRLRNLEGVSKVDSLAFALKAAAARAHGGDPRWEYVPRDTPALIEAVGALANDGLMVDSTCAVQPIVVHVAAAHAATIDNVRDVVARFAGENPSQDVRLSLAGPLAEVAAASDTIRAWEATVFLCVTVAFVAVGFVALRDWSAALGGALVILLPLLGIYWCMGARGFGLGAETLPVVAFALVLSADSVFGVIAAARRAARLGHALATAWRQALVDQGFVTGAKALCFAVAFGLWVYSPARLQAETGLFIVVATAIAFVLALGALPALLLLLEESMAHRSAEGFPGLSEETTRFRARMRAATGR